MDKVAIIRRMRERNIKWADVAYCLNTTEAAARMILKRSNDVQELGEMPVIKKSKFETPVILKLKDLAREDNSLSIRDLHGELTKIFPEKLIPSKSTLHKILNESGFKMLKLLKKTLIFPRNQLKRVEFCREMLNFGPAFWETVIWSDETTVRQRPQGKDITIRVHSSHIDDLEEINPQIHSGGFSIMFWGCFSKLGLGPLVALEGTMNSENYLELIKDTLLPEIDAAGRPMVFMQDNAPCHKAKRIMDFFAQENIETLNWPPQSPDMNPIENLWAIIKARRKKKYGVPTSRNELIEQIFDIWNDIDVGLVHTLAESANKRVQAVLKANGKVTKY